MNPCPCGFYGDAEKECRCSAYEIIKYQKKISGPLLDRIDIQVKAGRVAIEELRRGSSGDASGGESASIKERVTRAREIQIARRGKLNSELSAREVQDMMNADRDTRVFLETLDHSQLSPRGYYRLLKVARTIADLEKKDSVTSLHLAEAFSYRLKEIF